MASLSAALSNVPGPPYDPDYIDALDAYVAADQAREKAHRAFEKADQLARQREAELRAICERVTAGRKDTTPEDSDG
jgi:hypothetical protein